MPSFKDIEPFTRSANYHVNVSLDYLEDHIQRYIKEFDLDLNPDFQRGHVWNKEKQIKFMEFFIRGGKSATSIHFNHPNWMDSFEGRMVLVDGKQRLEAARLFMNNKIPVFGHFLNEFSDHNKLRRFDFDFYVNDLKTRKEVLKWYLDFNDGGVVHSKSEINKVKKLLEEEENK